ncbi:acyltransferase [Alkalicoccobacillus porphyridii]|uniref:Acyltransferase n=1 Tax=Alkalicoccobacillus porphyridii TaxID=2597270 RepID=A0A554A2D3_9BACI|nr:acyltransferase [Alkalicoccobacillus porphyridii]TSB47835.1 acyltransferase [Alkalicoccobacillus porphyridii]
MELMRTWYDKVNRNAVGFYKRMSHDVLVNIIGRSYVTPRSIRYMAYRAAGLKIKSTEVRSGCTIIGSNLLIEKNVLINHDVFIDCKKRVEIGENTYIAFRSVICTSTHQFGPDYQRAGLAETRPIKIGKGCWVGAGATILPGVTIGDGCIIAAGSVVRSNCIPHVLYAGIPAKPVKSLKGEEENIE